MNASRLRKLAGGGDKGEPGRAQGKKTSGPGGLIFKEGLLQGLPEQYSQGKGAKGFTSRASETA